MDDMKYAAVIEESYYEAGYSRDDSGNTVRYQTLKYFDSAAALEDFLIVNNQKEGYSKTKIIKLLKYQELEAKLTVSVSLK